MNRTDLIEMMTIWINTTTLSNEAKAVSCADVAEQYHTEQLRLLSVVRQSEQLCDCGGNERVALDCTLKPCKHPKYSIS